MKNSNLTKQQHFNRLIELFDTANTGIWDMNANGNVTFYNNNFYTAFDLPQSNSTLNDWVAIVHPDDQSLFEKRLVQHNESKVESYKSEYRVVNKNGETIWIEALGVSHFDDNGDLTYMVGYHTDITLKRTYKEKLFRIAYIDEQTGCFNRKKLLVEIDKKLKLKQSSTLIISELFNYNQQVSIHGHHFVESMLKLGAVATQNLLTDDYIAFRLSPSEIGLLCHKPQTNEEVKELISKMNTTFNHLSEVNNLSGNVKMTTSVLTFPLEDSSLTSEDILKRAYLAFTESDRTGTITFYNQKQESNILRKLYIESSILKGLKENEFFLTYQPIVSSDTESLMCFEALVRWHPPKWGLIAPDAFISVAEKNHEIIDIGDFVLENACAFIAKYRAKHNSNTKISVNVSVIQILQSNFADKVLNTLAKYELNYDVLNIEVTESIMINDTTQVIAQLTKLKSHDVGIVLDDFGSGYASLNTCIYLPLTEIKIDRQIMLQALEKPLIFSFLKSVTQLFHDHNMSIVAEGIENEELINISKTLKIDMLQGYYYSKPLSTEDALEY